MPDPDTQDERKARAVAKSATAFRTISEVSAELNVPQHVLRFWETKFPQVKPLKRGGGRRYYRPEDVDLLRRIQNLLYQQGYTIKGVQRLLREQRGALRDLPERTPDLLESADEATEAEPPEPVADLIPQEPVPVAAPEVREPVSPPVPASGVPAEPAVVPAPAVPAPDAPPPPVRLSPQQRGRIQTVLTELRALREVLRQVLG
ncbi:MAG TPA: MerR family transcriptional regulator [Azospirillaceae bacterium]|nr:MerR family transcriptional regulator [Azospirillaceae bacterium]